MSAYKDLLKEKNFLFYCIAQSFSQFGDRLIQIILIGFVYKMFPGSTMQFAKLLTFTIVPAFFVSPIAGVYVDRWNKKAVMLISDLVRGVLVLLIAFFLINSPKTIPLYSAIFLIFASACFFLPAKFSIIPDLIDEKKLLIANSVVSITGIVAGVAGFTLGGLMLEWMDLEWGLYINAVVYFLSAASLLFIVSTRRQDVKGRTFGTLSKEITKILEKPFFHDLKEGFKHLLQVEKVHFVIYTYFILMSAVGAVYVVWVVFVQETLLSMTKDIGLFGLFLCMGLLLGSLIYGKVGNKVSKNAAMFFSLISGGVFITIFAILLKLTASFAVGALIIFFLGIALSPIMISANTIVHESIEERLRGRIFSSLGIVMNIGLLLFMFLASSFAEVIGRMWVLVFSGSLLAGCGIVGILLTRKK